MFLSRLSTANISHSKGLKIPVTEDKERIAHGIYLEGEWVKYLTSCRLKYSPVGEIVYLNFIKLCTLRPVTPFVSRQRHEILFSKASSPALGPTRPILRVQVLVSPGQNSLGLKLTTHFVSGIEFLRNGGTSTSVPIRPRSAVLCWLSTGLFYLYYCALQIKQANYFALPIKRRDYFALLIKPKDYFCFTG